MKKDSGKLERVDKEFTNKMREAMKIRFEKGFIKFNSREMGMTEATRLLIRTPSFQKSLQELKTLPKKENLI